MAPEAPEVPAPGAHARGDTGEDLRHEAGPERDPKGSAMTTCPVDQLPYWLDPCPYPYKVCPVKEEHPLAPQGGPV